MTEHLFEKTMIVVQFV